MGELSTIEWCTHSFNPWWGCTKVSDGCKNCYADAFSHRYGYAVWGPKAGRRRMSENVWRDLAKWNRQAQGATERPRVFVASMADVFEGPETCQTPEAYAVVEAGRARLFDEIVKCSDMDFLLLTKRPENMIRFAPKEWEAGWPSNIWAGTSVEDQPMADKRIPELIKVPAQLLFLSGEPLLGRVDLHRVAVVDKADGVSTGIDALLGCRWWCSDQGEYGEDVRPISWVICGGESGAGARSMHPDWAQDLRDQCQESGVPFFFKQWGEHEPMLEAEDWTAELLDFDASEIPGLSRGTSIVWPDGRRVDAGLSRKWWENFAQTENLAGAWAMNRVGKKTAGHVLGGEVYQQFPGGAL